MKRVEVIKQCSTVKFCIWNKEIHCKTLFFWGGGAGEEEGEGQNIYYTLDEANEPAKKTSNH